MKYKGLILDIDNTLYDYQSCHTKALMAITQYFENEFSIDEKLCLSSYDKGRKNIHLKLNGYAASHNRLLYFQEMCNILNINPLKYALKLSSIYWNVFLDNMKLFDGVHDLLSYYKNKICFTTDLTADIQYKKIEKLNLSKFSHLIVTSEESGIEKPHPYIFLLSLKKLQTKTSEVCMIGDNFDKDIVGARNLNIDCIWLNNNNNKINLTDSKIIEVNKFNEIIKFV